MSDTLNCVYAKFGCRGRVQVTTTYPAIKLLESLLEHTQQCPFNPMLRSLEESRQEVNWWKQSAESSRSELASRVQEMAEYKSNVEPLINATFDQYRARNEREDEAIRIKLRDQIKARDSELVASKSEIVALKTAANLNQTELSKRTALIAGLKVSNANLSQACIDLDTLVKDVKAKLNSSQNEVKDLVSKNVALTNAVNRLDVKREQSKVKAKCADLEAQVKQLTAELIAAKCHIAELKFDSNMVPGLAAELAKVNAQVELIPQLKKDLEDKESVVIQLRSELEKVTMFVEPSSHASDFNDLVVAKEVARDFEHSEAKVQENEDSDLKTMTERINSLTTENDYLKEKVERFMTVLVLKANVLINKP